MPIENAPLSVSTTDYHTAGEPFRIVSSVGPIPGKTVLDKREWAIENLDHVRRLLVYEPRGHADMYGCFVTEPDDEDGGLGVLFFHNEGFSTACGHGTIALAIWAIESGVFAPSEPETQMVIDVPSGRLPVVVQVVDGFVPDFLLGEDPKEVKRGLKRSLRRLLDQRFDNLLFAHGVPLVGGGKEALGAFLEQGHHYSGSQCS